MAILTRVQKTALAALILAVFLGGGLFLAVKNRFFTGIRPTPPVSGPEIPSELEKELRGFLSRYLDAYKNAREKKNYEELKGFLSQTAAGSFSPQHITDIDDYQIGEISKPVFGGEGEQYAARLKIFKDGLPMNPPTGETWPVFITRENGGFKVKTWFFTLPF
jgi:hypothetical protein